MARSRFFGEVARAIRKARFCDGNRMSTRAGLERWAAEEERASLSRRTFLGGVGAVAALAAGGALLGTARARPVRGGPRVAIVGAGLAGLVCADQLARRGIRATVYDAHPNRVGGRVHTDRTTFPGQVGENGAELIDNLHKTMLGYAQELGLAREDLGKAPGRPTYYFFGRHQSEEAIVDEYRVLVARMRPDLRALSRAPTAYAHTQADVALDRTDLETYLGTRGQDLPLVRAALAEAYVAEYGLEPHQQSALNLLMFLHLDRRRAFTPFGVFSDERWHLVGGNDALTTGLADRLPGQIQLGARLTRLRRDVSGQYELYFNGGAVPERADAVVLALPFSTLRRVTLEPSLGLSDAKRRAIQELGYGANAKTMVGFDRRVWAEQGGNGAVYSDLPNVQDTWESNWSRAGAQAVLTDYSGGDRGAAIQRNAGGTMGCGGCHQGPAADSVLSDAGRGLVEQQVTGFVRDLERIFPGASAAASRDPFGRFVSHRGHWLAQPYSLGSYTCYTPGQFTTIAGLEGEAAGLLKFAGEHADSFYEWQGFMEGACNSGVAAANALLADMRAGRLPA